MKTSEATTLLSINQFREMDYTAIEKYNLPIELMMENAGLNLARLVSRNVDKTANIVIGIGTGNNGGGGLVAARRLAGWGFNVSLHIPDFNLNSLPALQLKRTLAFGVKPEPINNPDVFVDAYLGFSQRLPLSSLLALAVENANKMNCLKISLDIPTGFNIKTGDSFFKPDIILTMAAMKKELLLPGVKSQLFITDLGIPNKLYCEFGIEQPIGFASDGLIRYL